MKDTLGRSRTVYQDPEDVGSGSLLEGLAVAAAEARSGGALFAFASRDGVSLLFKDEGFRRFVSVAPFDLIVGIDAITNPAALAELRRQAIDLPELRVRAFMHKRPRTLFHPKFAWFTTKTGGRLLVGSGNLTPGGLVGNWEAFTLIDLDRAQADRVRADWDAWTARHAHNLRAVDEPAVVARAARNVQRVIRTEEADEDAIAKAPSLEIAAAVLVAEVPRADVRWNQANFDLATFRGYFALEPGETRRVLLWPVDNAGAVGEVEVRQSVAVKSRNFRIELGEAAGKVYPTSGRPFAVFLAIGTRRFRYMLLMPGSRGYGRVDAILAKRWAGPAGRMRRVTLTARELRGEWPGCPLRP